MKYWCVLLLLVMSSALTKAQPVNDSLFAQLNKVIAQSHEFDATKEHALDSMRALFSKATTPNEQYTQALALYEAYKIYKFDSAFNYARVMETIAIQSQNGKKAVAARQQLAFVLLSAGKFSEAYSYLSSIQPQQLNDSSKADYYVLLGRYYYDLADYNSDEVYSEEYRAKGNRYLDTALHYLPTNSFEHIYYTVLRNLKSRQLEQANSYFQQLLTLPGLNDHQLAIVTSTLSHYYDLKHDAAKAIHYQLQAAIADIRSSTKETFATFNLAQLLYGQGDFEQASIYIQKAIDDASFYGARQRKVQVSAILPIIQGEKINYIEKQKQRWLYYALVVTSFLVILGCLIFIIYKQFTKLKKAEKAINEARNHLEEANAKLQAVNAQLQSVNHTLQDVNGKLEEANKIKEEYIGYFFNINAAFFEKLEKFKRQLDQKVADRKMEEIRLLANNINIRHEREELLTQFDKVFLKLFPTFVEEFNALFLEEDRIVLKSGELLNNELRMYALMRMGITENEKIAQILEYSIKTIYAYKTKIRNRTIVPKDDFDNRVMRIKSI
ncbi:hypothetical protein LX64_03389 [Chitinophaga skermanii]|uniref:DUF6377 domain-containing protein n=1 Tax=Chitinophaga skermanii TaxID=331697 RepID=A0A327QKV0_9BACT|nr:DUF6377 domain-containing protein [Chitinophaga skermanii]RAJ02377.1 hypothetical protein LX64_03389 [Chitinophaga skermanii]